MRLANPVLSVFSFTSISSRYNPWNQKFLDHEDIAKPSCAFAIEKAAFPVGVTKSSP
jgi:hypothetical protein